MKLFKNRSITTNPEVIACNSNKVGNSIFEGAEKSGVFYRVIPANMSEINALKILEHRIDKFAPATGEGVIITADAMQMLDA